MYFLASICPRHKHKGGLCAKAELSTLLLTVVCTFANTLFYQIASAISSPLAVLPEATDFMLRGSRLPQSPLFSEVLSSGTQPTSDFVLCVHRAPLISGWVGTQLSYAFPLSYNLLSPYRKKEYTQLEHKTTQDLIDYPNQQQQDSLFISVLVLNAKFPQRLCLNT